MYRLELTAEDCRTIEFVGGRYSWSEALRGYLDNDAGELGCNIEMPEHEAWSVKEAFEADMEGGHSPFPMLDERSDLCAKLNTFWESIV